VRKSSRNNRLNNIKNGYGKKGAHLDLCNILDANEFETQF
jgi:hypothetical protein